MGKTANRLALLASTILAMAFSAVADEQVLYWMVGDSATVQDNKTGQTIGGIQEFLSAETEISAARIRVEGDGITEDTFLTLYAGNGETFDGEFGVEFEDNGSGYWGAGVPTGNQSPLGGYASDDPEYYFIIELGNITLEDGVPTWVTVATSESKSYSSLLNSGYIQATFDISPSSERIWNPTVFTTPEPSGALLLLIGGGLLMLRRRGKDGA